MDGIIRLEYLQKTFTSWRSSTSKRNKFLLQKAIRTFSFMQDIWNFFTEKKISIMYISCTRPPILKTSLGTSLNRRLQEVLPHKDFFQDLRKVGCIERLEKIFVSKWKRLLYQASTWFSRCRRNLGDSLCIKKFKRFSLNRRPLKGHIKIGNFKRTPLCRRSMERVL